MPIRPLRWRLPRRELLPKLTDADAVGWEHAVLQAVQIPPVDGRHKLARRKAQEDAWREVMLSYAGAELEVGMEHGGERQRYGLPGLSGVLEGASSVLAYLEIDVGRWQRVEIVWGMRLVAPCVV